MKILDFGSGTPEDAMENWTPDIWIPKLQTFTEGRVQEVLQIHCFDPICIRNPKSQTTTHAQFHFHTDIREVPDKIDVVCAMHPNPRVLGNSPTERLYVGMLAFAIQEKVKTGGKVVIQFDTVMQEVGNNTGSTKFLKMLHQAIEDHVSLEYNSGDVIAINSFPSQSYDFSSLHVFEKKAA